MCDNCGWEDFQSDINDFLDEGKESYFLESVLEWIEENQHITEAQKEGAIKWLER